MSEFNVDSFALKLMRKVWEIGNGSGLDWQRKAQIQEAIVEAVGPIMTQQAVEPTDRLRFKSACEISGEKHPEYVRGYEAAMDAVCKTQRFTATDEAQPAPIPTAWQPIETAPTDVLHVRGLWVYSKSGAPVLFEQCIGFVDDEGFFVDRYGYETGWNAEDYTHWHPLEVPAAPGGEG